MLPLFVGRRPLVNQEQGMAFKVAFLWETVDESRSWLESIIKKGLSDVFCGLSVGQWKKKVPKAVTMLSVKKSGPFIAKNRFSFSNFCKMLKEKGKDLPSDPI